MYEVGDTVSFKYNGTQPVGEIREFVWPKGAHVPEQRRVKIAVKHKGWNGESLEGSVEVGFGALSAKVQKPKQPKKARSQ